MDIQKLELIPFEKDLAARKQAVTDPKFRDRIIMRMRRSEDFWCGTALATGCLGVAMLIACIVSACTYDFTPIRRLIGESCGVGVQASVAVTMGLCIQATFATNRLARELAVAKQALPPYVVSYLETRKQELDDLLRRVRGFNGALEARKAADASLTGIGSDGYQPDDLAAWSNRRDALQTETEAFLAAFDETFELTPERLAEAAKHKPIFDRIEELKELEASLVTLHQDGYQEGADEASFGLVQSLRHSIECEIAERNLPPKLLPPAPKTKKKLLRAAAN